MNNWKGWKIIRNENNDIVKYELTKNIYISRELDNRLDKTTYTHTLIVNGKEKETNVQGSGYTIKMLRELAEKIKGE